MDEYKRLTRIDDKGRWVAEAGHYGVYLDSETHADMMHGDIVNRLAELENMTEKIGEYSLPVGIGDTVYYVALKICKIIFSENNVSFIGRNDWREMEFYISAFETNVVLTEEEAKKKSEEWSR